MSLEGVIRHGGTVADLRYRHMHVPEHHLVPFVNSHAPSSRVAKGPDAAPMQGEGVKDVMRSGGKAQRTKVLEAITSLMDQGSLTKRPRMS